MKILQVCPGYFPAFGGLEQHVRNELCSRRFLSTSSSILHRIKEMGELRR